LEVNDKTRALYPLEISGTHGIGRRLGGPRNRSDGIREVSPHRSWSPWPSSL